MFKFSSKPCFEKMFFLFFSMLITVALVAQPRVVPLYNGPAPGSEKWDWEEGKALSDKPAPVKFPIAYNITKPTLTIFSPDSLPGNGTAIIICPGGALGVLNVETEGRAIAEKLAKKGITVFLLKHRVIRSKTAEPWNETISRMGDTAKFRADGGNEVRLMARGDALTAMLHVRQNAAKYNIDQNKIGFIGFSSGAGLALHVVTGERKEARPNFAAFIYGGRLTPDSLSEAPPAFIVSATDDALSKPLNSINLYKAWIENKRPAELHLYAKGGHGLWGAPANTWLLRFEEWLEVQGFLPARK
jgi:acetyl esterase/lipase